ncbi:MAG: CCA tRNA nucleotidyltransferase [Limimaricola sp.]|uniref:CCA tRNA nucleotidyltransferase n=1 Tax=Limimaricola sp. TaxID=2211665 RepID=UPI001D911ECE|nr:CCA tRNA nucleotidyltransferase [Limimaricola sp.]MBI1417201.1 CCA tRNA nucleotidyltransferase [Limimaricola sp.]
MTRIDAPWLTSDGARAVMAALSGGGQQAWFVGGCVRNALLGVPVSDIDIATDARPDRVSALAEAAGLRVVPTGIDHGTVTVIAGHQPYEVTTFRRDIETDGRRAVVAFADSISEDAHRRDFTMNALYAAPDGTLSDPIGGLPDLRAGHVRFIDHPEDRIREDYLRILRFFRFHAWYGDPAGGLDPDGLAACAALHDGLAKVSAERCGQEMMKLLAAPDPAPAVAAMTAAGVLTALVPGAGAGLLTVLIHVEGVAGLSPDPIRRLAALGGQEPERALRLSRAEAARLQQLRTSMQDETGPGELGYRLGATMAQDVLVLRAALGGREADRDDLQMAVDGALQVFPLRAADLMPGLSGPELGVALREAEARWIASGFALGRDELVSLAANRG